MRRTRWVPAVLVGLGMVVFAAGPAAAAWDLTGKERITQLEAENAKLFAQGTQQKAILDQKESEIKALTAQLEELKSQKSQLDAEVALLGTESADMKKQLELKGGVLAECEAKLATEAKRGTGIKVIFFGGDIIYEVFTDAFNEYRAGLRYRSLTDRDFAEKLQSFEQGMGGDLEVLAVLKDMDLSKDRLVDLEEAQTFRKKVEAQ